MRDKEIFIIKKIKYKTIQEIIFLCFILLAILTVLIGFSRDYINYTIGAIKGPIFISEKEFENNTYIKNLEHKYIRVRLNEIFATGLVEIEQEINKTTKKVVSEKIKKIYWGCRIGNKLFIYSSADKEKKYEITGLAKKISLDLEKKIFKARTPKSFLPLIIENRKTNIGFWAGRVIILFVIFGISFLIIIGVKGLRHPEKDEIFDKLNNKEQILDLSKKVEEDLKEANVLFKHKNLMLTNNFMVLDSFMEFKIHPIADIIWVYKKVTKTKSLFITIDTEYDIIFVFCNGIIEAASISSSKHEEVYEEIVSLLSKKMPWIIFGYNKELSEKGLLFLNELVKLRKKEFLNRNISFEEN